MRRACVLVLALLYVAGLLFELLSVPLRVRLKGSLVAPFQTVARFLFFFSFPFFYNNNGSFAPQELLLVPWKSLFYATSLRCYQSHVQTALWDVVLTVEPQRFLRVMLPTQ